MHMTPGIHFLPIIHIGHTILGRFAKESRRDSRLGSEGTPTEPPGGAKRRFSIDSLRTTFGGSRLQASLADPNGLSTENVEYLVRSTECVP